MPWEPPAFRGAPVNGAVSGERLPGEIDYRLARQSLISEYRKGRLARHEVCDAQPELLRAARNVGEESSRTCPICEEASVVLVSYVFGPRMPAHGRCITTRSELQKVSREAAADLACYVVEVCPSCRWNHLARAFLIPATRGRARAGGPNGSTRRRSAPFG
jgi:hypothetical protein